jgi:hypothetical protein
MIRLLIRACRGCRVDLLGLLAAQIALAVWAPCASPVTAWARQEVPGAARSRGDGPSADDPAAAGARFVLEGMREGRRQLRSGVCTVAFTTRHDDSKSPRLSDAAEIRMRMLFDANGNSRLEDTYPRLVAERARYTEPWTSKQQSAPDTRTGYFIHTTDRNIQFFEGQPWAFVLPPDSAYPGWIIAFDLKAIGFYSWVDFKWGVSWETLIEGFLRKPGSKVAESPDDIYTITWSLGSPDSEWIVKIDGTKGFSPFYAMMRQRESSAAPWRTVQEFKTDWKKTDSVWVPVRYEAASMQDPNVKDSVTMELSWSAVNKSVDQRIFTLESLKTAAAAGVVDSRLGAPVEVRRGTLPQAGPAAPNGDLKPSARRTWLATIVITNLLVISIAFGVWFLKSRSRRRP